MGCGPKAVAQHREDLQYKADCIEVAKIKENIMKIGVKDFLKLRDNIFCRITELEPQTMTRQGFTGIDNLRGNLRKFLF